MQEIKECSENETYTEFKEADFEKANFAKIAHVFDNGEISKSAKVADFRVIVTTVKNGYNAKNAFYTKHAKKRRLHRKRETTKNSKNASSSKKRKECKNYT